jgi:hypothetical protein
MSVEDHLAYEVRQLRWDLERLSAIWPAMHGATPTNMVEGTAYFEAALLHARNLIEFLLRGSSPHSDAITPRDFGLVHYDFDSAGRRFEDELGIAADVIYERICSYVSHLSRARDVGIPGWELQPLEAVLCDLVASFVADVEATGQTLHLVRDALAEELPSWY